MTNDDYKNERDSDVEKILNSFHDRKIVVAGPGTGKSYLFEQIIKKEKENGEWNDKKIISKFVDWIPDKYLNKKGAMGSEKFKQV
jgi:hypothetical protein